MMAAQSRKSLQTFALGRKRQWPASGTADRFAPNRYFNLWDYSIANMQVPVTALLSSLYRHRPIPRHQQDRGKPYQFFDEKSWRRELIEVDTGPTGKQGKERLAATNLHRRLDLRACCLQELRFDFALRARWVARTLRISGSPCIQALSIVMRLKRHFWPSRTSSQS